MAIRYPAAYSCLFNFKYTVAPALNRTVSGISDPLVSSSRLVKGILNTPSWFGIALFFTHGADARVHEQTASRDHQGQV